MSGTKKLRPQRTLKQVHFMFSVKIKFHHVYACHGNILQEKLNNKSSPLGLNLCCYWSHNLANPKVTSCFPRVTHGFANLISRRLVGTVITSPKYLSQAQKKLAGFKASYFLLYPAHGHLAWLPKESRHVPLCHPPLHGHEFQTLGQGQKPQRH